MMFGDDIGYIISGENDGNRFQKFLDILIRLYYASFIL
jgi:hypothetical protein